MSEILLARGLRRAFGSVKGLDGADFDINAGEVVGLIGDNGAGKSTLVKALTGNLGLDSGSIQIDGKPVELHSPEEASRHGIEVVHQDLALAPHLNAVQNMFLGREVMKAGIAGRFGFMDEPRMRVRTAEALNALGSTIRSLRTPIGNLSGGQRQSIAIARAVSWANRVLFLDEPTAALGVVQTRNVLDAIRRVRDLGIAVVFISHSMPHVLEVTDRVEVMRLGRRVAQYKTSATSTEQLVGSMTGAIEYVASANGEKMTMESTGSIVVELEPSIWNRLKSMQSIWILAVLCGIVLAFGVVAPDKFLTLNNLANIGQNIAVWAIIAVGMTFVIITSGIDLSVGSVLVFASVIAAKLMEVLPGPGWLVAVLGTIVAAVLGVAWGIVNGWLIAYAKIPPLIVTLGTLSIALGIAQIITGGIDVRSVPEELQDAIGYGRFLGVPVSVVFAVGIVLIGGVLLHKTRFGRHTYAIGSSQIAAQRVGIHVNRKLVAVYALAGLLSGIAAVVSLAQFGTTTIVGQSLTNLNVIAAVVIGGTSVFGGYGSMFGSMVGLCIPAVLQSGFVITGVSPFWQTVAVGAILIASVYIDQYRRSVSTRSGKTRAVAAGKTSFPK